MFNGEITPDTPVEELALHGVLSKRALKILHSAELVTVHDIAVYHQNDPRYTTLGGCGLVTRREFNRLIKSAYGSLKVKPLNSKNSATRAPKEKGWQAQWLEMAEGTDDIMQMELTGVAAELEYLHGPLSVHDRRYYLKCREYARFIRQRNGVPEAVTDIALHQWFLQQCQSSLSRHREALFTELCQEIGIS